MKKYLLAIFIILLSSVAFAVSPSENLYLNTNTVIDSGTFLLVDAGDNGALIVNASNIMITCPSDAYFIGNNQSGGTGIYVGAFSNVTVLNCNFDGYTQGVKFVSSGANNKVLGGVYRLHHAFGSNLYGVYSTVGIRNLTVNNTIMYGEHVNVNSSYKKATGISIERWSLSDGLVFGNNTIYQLSTGISINGLNIAGDNLANGSLCIGNHIVNVSDFGIISGGSNGRVIGNTFDYCGVDCVSPRKNDFEGAYSTFNMSGHKMGYDMITNDSAYVQGRRYDLHHNNFTSTQTYANRTGWRSSGYTPGSYCTVNADGDYANAPRGTSDIHAWNNNYINILDNDTRTQCSRTWGIDMGNFSRNILIENETYINTSGYVYYSSSTNLTTKNSVIQRHNNTAAPYDYGLFGYSTHTSNTTIINMTKVDGNLTIYFEQNNMSEVYIYQNSSFIITAASNAGGRYTIFATAGFNDIFDPVNLLAENFTTYTAYLAAGRSVYVTNKDIGGNGSFLPPEVSCNDLYKVEGISYTCSKSGCDFTDYSDCTIQDARVS